MIAPHPIRRLPIALWLLLGASVAFSTRGAAVSTAVQRDGSPAAAARACTVNITVAHAPDNGVTLVHRGRGQEGALDSRGKVSFSSELVTPGYLDLVFELASDKPLRLFARPGDVISLDCDASDVLATAKFADDRAAENTALMQIQAAYAAGNYGRLYFAPGFDEFVRSERARLEQVLANLSGAHPGLDRDFMAFERERVIYWEANARYLRTKYHGDGKWSTVLSKLDFDINDTRLLDVDTYTLFLHRYIASKAGQRLAEEPALRASMNQQTEARYAVVIAASTNPEVRDFQLHDILHTHLAGDPDRDEGPLGSKGMDKVIAGFDRDCTDVVFRTEIDSLYRQWQDGRNAPVIRIYKTIGTTTLDAHIFPAVGAKPGERRPAFLFFHGGGWAIGTPEWGYDGCRYYSQRGLVAISFEYRIRMRHGTTVVESVADAKSAVRWARAHAQELGIDPTKIVVAGFSAGGHLAAAVGIVPGGDDPRDDTSISAVPNAIVMSSAAVEASNLLWYEENVGHGEPADYAPAQHVRPGLPPTISFHGFDDELSPFAFDEAFCKAMKAAGNRCEQYARKGGHFPTAAADAVIREKTDKFLESLGYLAGAKKS